MNISNQAHNGPFPLSWSHEKLEMSSRNTTVNYEMIFCPLDKYNMLNCMYVVVTSKKKDQN